jgi:hypothetical protein
MFIGLSQDLIRTELGEDATVYTVRPTGTTAVLELPCETPNGTQNAVLFFLKKEDAEHFQYLLNELSPAYKDVDLEVAKGPVGLVLAEDDTFVFALLGPAEAKRFFETNEEQMSKYYGI